MLHRLLLTIFPIIVCGFSSKAQVNFPFLGSHNPVWLQSEHCSFGVEGCHYQVHESFVQDGIDTIDGVEYTMISYETYSFTTTPWECTISSGYTIPHLLGMREDSGKVYRRMNQPGEQEYLMYDFTAEIGDTVPSPQVFDNGAVFEINVVNAIDSILIDGAYRKRWWIQGQLQDNFYIEGIGNHQGLTHPMSEWFECVWYLDCYSANGQEIYPDTGVACDPVIAWLNVEEEKAQVNLFTATNDANGVVLSPKKLGEAINYSIYNTSGQLIKSGNLTDEVVLSSQNMRAGIYVVVANSDKDFQTQTIFVPNQ